MRIIVLSFFLINLASQINGQVASVEQTLSGVRENVSRVNQLAENHDIYKAVELLNTTRRDFDTYVSHYIDDEYRAARIEKQAYAPELNLKFSSKLTAAYWEERVKRSQRAIDNAKEAFAARNYQRTLNAQDEVWTYLKTAYTVANTIKDVAENIITQNYVDAAKSAYDGANDFIGNYKEIEDARLQIINTNRYEIELQTLIKRAERMEETNWQFASYMRAYEQDVDDFYGLINRFNMRVKTLSSETLTEWSDSDFSWNSQPFLSKIDALGNQFKTNNQDYQSVKKQIENIISQAEIQKEQVEQKISETNLPEKVDKLNKLEEDFDEFYNLAFDVIDECYRVSQTKTTDQPGNQSVNVSSQNVDRQNTISQSITANQGTNANINQEARLSGKRVPNVYFHSYWSDNRGNKFKFRQNDQNVEIEGVGVGQIQNGVLIYSYTESDGTRRKNEYRLLEDGFKMEVKQEWSDKMIKDHLTIQNNFTAPSQQKINEFRKTNDNFIFSVLNYAGSTMATFGDADGDKVPDEFDRCANTPSGLTVDNGGVDIMGCPVKGFSEENTASKQDAPSTTSSTQQTTHTSNSVRQQSQTTSLQQNTGIKSNVGTSNPANSVSDKDIHSDENLSDAFNDLIKKANEAFNRYYWQENGTNSSGNPKQESINYLKEAQKLIPKQENLTLRYVMVYRLAGVYAGFAKRVFAYANKDEFIHMAGGMLNQTGSVATSIDADFGGLSAEKVRSICCKSTADAWRELTKAALWGNHQYNKMYCDEQAKKFYVLALRNDQSNTELRQKVEKINAPKKPVPSSVSATPPIPENQWAKAENMRNMMVENTGDFVSRITDFEKPNYMAVGELSLNSGGGKVQIMHSGTSEWKDVGSGKIDIYPGDKIKTGADATDVSFEYGSDRSFLAIKPGAAVTIFEDQLLIERGDVYVRVVKKGGDFLVVTPTAVTGPRGTEFSVSADADKTKVNLYEGVIEMRSGFAISFLIPGESASIATDEDILIEKFNAESDKNQNWNRVVQQVSASQKSKTEQGFFSNVTGGFTVIESEKVKKR